MQRDSGTALAVLAHPDDAEFLCGGTLALLALRGWRIHVATSTPGNLGSTELPPDEIAAIRRAEGAAAAQVIGGHYHCLELRDLRVDPWAQGQESKMDPDPALEELKRKMRRE